MVRGSGKKLAVSPVWCQWHTTTPFSSPDTTRLQSIGDQWTAVMAVCTQGKSQKLVEREPLHFLSSPGWLSLHSNYDMWKSEGSDVMESGVDAHLMSSVFSDKSPDGSVPDADAAVTGGADADVILACMMTE